MTKGKWKANDATCPRCNGTTENLVVIDLREDDWGEEEYIDAERCPRCRWIVDFTADEIKARAY